MARLSLTLAAATATLLALTTGCAGAGGPEADPATGPRTGATASTTAPQATPGNRLVALGRVAVEVPDTWLSEVFDGCGRTPDGAVVFRLEGIRPQCGDRLDRRRSWVVLEHIDPEDGLLLAMRGAGRVDGARVRQTGLVCAEPVPSTCDVTFAVASERVVVQVHSRGQDARGQVQTIRQSLRLVPDGWVAVPPIPFGTSDEDALALLDEAGLEGRIPTVDWPHYVTASEPPAGTLVEVGAVVDLQIGDG